MNYNKATNEPPQPLHSKKYPLTKRKWTCLAFIIAASGFLMTLSSCYSFTGANFDPNIQTYWVAPFVDNADNAPAGLSTDFTEALKEKIRTQSRLSLTENNPHIEFRGTLVDYRITAEAPQPGERTSLSRLTIVTAIEYINSLNEESNWKSNFSYFFDFPSNQDFTSIEEEATQTIIDQIMEDIFNRAFTNW